MEVTGDRLAPGLRGVLRGSRVHGAGAADGEGDSVDAMRGRVSGAATTAGMAPHNVVAWESPPGWIGEILVGRELVRRLSPVATRGEALTDAEAYCRECARAGLWFSVGTVRADHLVRVEATAPVNGRDVLVAAWVDRSESAEDVAAHFVPGTREFRRTETTTTGEG